MIFKISKSIKYNNLCLCLIKTALYWDLIALYAAKSGQWVLTGRGQVTIPGPVKSTKMSAPPFLTYFSANFTGPQIVNLPKLWVGWVGETFWWWNWLILMHFTGCGGLLMQTPAAVSTNCLDVHYGWSLVGHCTYSRALE